MSKQNSNDVIEKATKNTAQKKRYGQAEQPIYMGERKKFNFGEEHQPIVHTANHGQNTGQRVNEGFLPQLERVSDPFFEISNHV